MHLAGEIIFMRRINPCLLPIYKKYPFIKFYILFIKLIFHRKVDDTSST